MKDAGHSWRIFEAAKRKKYKPGKAIPGRWRDKEDERAEWSEGGGWGN